MKDKRNIIIAALLIAVVMMSVGYATFSQNLDINGSATIDADASWDVEIISIDGAKTGDADFGEPTFTKTTASFAAVLQKPGDTATYTITVENKGTINAKLDSYTHTPEAAETSETASDDYILYTVISSPALESELAPGDTAEFVVTAKFNEAKEDLPTEDADKTKDFTGTISYVQAD